MSNAPVLISRQIPEAGLDLFREAKIDFEILCEDRNPTREELLNGIVGRSALLSMLTDQINEEFLTAAGSELKVVANYAVGFNNFDLAAMNRHGVVGTNTPGVLTDATADIAWALVMASVRRIAEGDRMMRTTGFDGWGPMMLLGDDLVGKTIGIVGAGRIGQAVARRSLGWGMKILYTARSAKPEFERELGAEKVTFEKLLESSDIVSVNLPHTPETHHLFDAAAFKRMKNSAHFINTARGAIHDESALVKALENGEIAGAGLDVYENEPEVAPGLLRLDSVVLLPHIGSGTVQTRERMACLAAQNILCALRGDQPPNLIQGPS